MNDSRKKILPLSWSGLGSRSNTLHISFTALLSVAVYGNALFNGFVIDDMSQVVENPWIRDARHLSEIFSSSVWMFEGRDSNYYRPLMHVIYMLVYKIAGLKPLGYHLVNVLFHSASSVLVLLATSRILRNIGPSRSNAGNLAPMAAAALFATHPIHTEAVAWVAGILDLSFTFFFLLSLFLYVRSGSDYGVGFAMSVLAFMLSTLCKEPALTLPFILLAYDFAVSKRDGRQAVDVKRYIPFLVAGGIYMALRYRALGGFAPVEVPVRMDYYEYCINVISLVSQYMSKLFLPVGLNNWHVFRPLTTILSARGIAAVVVAAGMMAGGWISVRRNRGFFLCLLIVLLPLAPTLYISALTQGSENAFAERYLYLPSFGFVLFAASLLERVLTDKQRWYFPAIIAVFATVVVYSVGTVSRNTVWKDSYTLWSDAAIKSPDSSRAHENLGYSLFFHGRAEEGKKELQIASKLDPDLYRAKIEKGIAYGNKGLVDKAIFEFNIALMFKPDSAEAHYSLGNAYDAKGWVKEAIEQYEIALKLDPRYADAHNNLGIAFAKNNLLERAVYHFEEAARLNPGDNSIRRNLAKAYEMTGRAPKPPGNR